MKRGIPAPTKEESERIKAISRMGCIITWLRRGVYAQPEIQHIKEGNRQLGHWYTIPLTPWYHRAVCDAGMSEKEMTALYGPSLALGSKPFEKSHGTERWLWEQVQKRLGLPAKWRESKILPRRIA